MTRRSRIGRRQVKAKERENENISITRILISKDNDNSHLCKHNCAIVIFAILIKSIFRVKRKETVRLFVNFLCSRKFLGNVVNSRCKETHKNDLNISKNLMLRSIYFHKTSVLSLIESFQVFARNENKTCGAHTRLDVAAASFQFTIKMKTLFIRETINLSF